MRPKIPRYSPRLKARRFFWEVLIALVPLILLTGLALRTLLGDQQEVQSKARKEAEDLVNQVARNAVQVLEETTSNAYFARQSWYALAFRLIGVDAEKTGMIGMIKDAPADTMTMVHLIRSGLHRIDSPVPYRVPRLIVVRNHTNFFDVLPRPKLNLIALPPWKSTIPHDRWMQWRELEEAERVAGGDPLLLAQLSGKYADFAIHELTPALRILAEFHALRLRSGTFVEFARFVARHGGILNESGVPLAVNGAGALIHMWKRSQPALIAIDLLNALVPILIQYPTPLNASILSAADQALEDKGIDSRSNVGAWVAFEEELERVRVGLLSVETEQLKKLIDERVSWVELNSQEAKSLAFSLELPEPGNVTGSERFGTALFSFEEVEELMNYAIQRVALPSWAGARIELGGSRFGDQSGGDELASTKKFPGGSGGVETVEAAASGQINLHAMITLSRPEILMGNVIRRQRVYGLLVLAAAGAAGFGLIHARRSFYRQLQLAEMRSGFVSSVSHELRAPIASIWLLAEGLDRGNVTSDEHRRDYLRFIVQECRRLSGLIENVLDYSRIEQGRKVYEPEVVDGVRLVQDTVKLMEPTAELSKVSLSVALPSDLGEVPEVMWDGAAIQQALVNLIDNAVKHSPEGASVIIRLKVVPATNAKELRCIELSVADQGAGIPKAEHERIFEQFYRRGSELRRETRGIGIGLSLVKHTVECHGGIVKVESEIGRGSIFTMVIPALPMKK